MKGCIRLVRGLVLIVVMLWGSFAWAQGVTYHVGHPELSPNENEGALQEALRHEFGLAGQALPTLDVNLVMACRHRAEGLLTMNKEARNAEKGRKVQTWLLRHGVTDLQSTSAFGVANETKSLLSELVAWAKTKVAEKPSHVGVGVVTKDGQTAAVVVLLKRYVLLRPLANYLKTPGGVLLEGKTLAGARRPMIYLTNPNGYVEEFKPFTTAIGVFSESIRLNKLGTWLVQVMVDSTEGRTAANQFPLYVGYKRAKKQLRATIQTQGKSLKELRQQSLAYINLARNAGNRASLSLDTSLNEVAQRHARWMAEQSRVSHLDDEGRSPKERLAAFGVNADRFGENLGRNPNLSRLLEETLQSPSHRKVLMDARFNALGLGLVYKKETQEWFAAQLYATMMKSTNYAIARQMDLPRSVFREINAQRRRSRQADLVLEPGLTEMAKAFVKASRSRNSLNETRLRARIEQAMDSDPNRKIGMYTLLPLSDSSELLRFAGFNNSAWTHVGLVLLEQAKGGYLAVILLSNGRNAR